MSWFVGLSPESGSMLTAWGLLGIFSLSAPVPLVRSLSLSLKINKLKCRWSLLTLISASLR